MRTCVVEFQLLLALAMLSGCAKQPPDRAASVLDGDWIVVAMKGDATATTPEEVAGMKWHVAGNVITATDPDGSTGKMRVKLDPETNSIDITALDGNRKEETDQGIYSLDHERLTICLAEPASGSRRPVGFAANSESWILELQKVRR